MSCATMSLLLLEQSHSYETSSVQNQYSSCIRSMRLRYLKRLFIIGKKIFLHNFSLKIFVGQWLPSLSKIQFNDIQLNHERYIEIMIDHLFPAISLRDKINGFIENYLLNNNDENDLSDNEAATTSDFVFIRRFPKFNEKTIEQNSDLMHIALVNTLNQCKIYCHTCFYLCSLFSSE
jgi:hypothetical protein